MYRDRASSIIAPQGACPTCAYPGAPVWAVELKGQRYNCGDKIGYVKAFVDAALGRNDTGPAVRAHLEGLGWKAPRAR